MSQPSRPSAVRRWAIAGLAAILVAAGAAVIALPQLGRTPGTPGSPGAPVDVPGDGDGNLALRPTGDDAPISSPIAISFGRDVPHAAIAQGFSITPAAEGQLSWQGNTLVFRPAYPGLARGTAYQVSVRLPEDVAAAVGAPANPLTYQFTTAGKLAVASTSPEADSTEVGFDVPLMVSFNRPVAPLTTLTSTATPLLKLDPPVEGEGRWLNSTIYQFTPASGWAPSTTYRVTVPRTVSDTLGGQLGEDATWSFATAGPAVTDTSPRDNAQYVGPQGEVRVTFNLPVDRAAAEAAFRLSPAAAGTFSWPDSRTMVFRPSAPYQPATRYSASVAVSPASSKLTTWSFTTVGAPAVAKPRRI